MNEPTITMIGNLADDPELRFTPSGVAVAKFRMAMTPRDKAAGGTEWKDGEPLWMSVTCWRSLGENVAESLIRGMRVVVHGRLKSRTYETTAGEKRTVTELEAEAVGPELTWATAKVQRKSRSDGEGSSSRAAAPAREAAPAKASADTQRSQAADEDPPW